MASTRQNIPHRKKIRQQSALERLKRQLASPRLEGVKRAGDDYIKGQIVALEEKIKIA